MFFFPCGVQPFVPIGTQSLHAGIFAGLHLPMVNKTAEWDGSSLSFMRGENRSREKNQDEAEIGPCLRSLHFESLAKKAFQKAVDFSRIPPGKRARPRARSPQRLTPPFCHSATRRGDFLNFFESYFFPAACNLLSRSGHKVCKRGLLRGFICPW